MPSDALERLRTVEEYLRSHLVNMERGKLADELAAIRAELASEDARGESLLAICDDAFAQFGFESSIGYIRERLRAELGGEQAGVNGQSAIARALESQPPAAPICAECGHLRGLHGMDGKHPCWATVSGDRGDQIYCVSCPGYAPESEGE